MPEENANLGEQALSKAAEIGIASQLDEVKNVNVNVAADPLQIVQGEVEAVVIEGEGMVMQQDLRIEAMKLQTNKISIDPLKAAFGKIELRQPTQATAEVVLQEQDINRALNSNYLRDKLQNLQIQVDQQPMTLETCQVSFWLPGDRKVGVSAEVVYQETGEHQQVAFTALPQKSADGQRLVLSQVQYSEGKEISPELTAALLDKVSQLLDLRNFELEGMTLQLQDFQVNQTNITLQAVAQVVEFPAA